MKDVNSMNSSKIYPSASEEILMDSSEYKRIETNAYAYVGYEPTNVHFRLGQLANTNSAILSRQVERSISNLNGDKSSPLASIANLPYSVTEFLPLNAIPIFVKFDKNLDDTLLHSPSAAASIQGTAGRFFDSHPSFAKLSNDYVGYNNGVNGVQKQQDGTTANFISNSNGDPSGFPNWPPAFASRTNWGQQWNVLSDDGSTVYHAVGYDTIYPSPTDMNLLSSFSSGNSTNPAWTFTIGTGAGISMQVEQYDSGFFQPYNSGGGAIVASFTYSGTQYQGYTLQWIQIFTSNYPYGTETTANNPALDNGGATSQPFYANTVANTAQNLPAGELNFWDFSMRPPVDDEQVADPVYWTADLFPVLWNQATNNVILEPGINWGWIDGCIGGGMTATGTFNLQYPGGTVSNNGTSDVVWDETDEGGYGGQVAFVSGPGQPDPNDVLVAPVELGVLEINAQTQDQVDGTLSIFIDFPALDNLGMDKDFTASVPVNINYVGGLETITIGNAGLSVGTTTNLVWGSAYVYGMISYSSATQTYSLQITSLSQDSAGTVTNLALTGVANSQALVNGTSTSPFVDVSIGDTETGTSQTLTVTNLDPAAGAFSNLGDGSYNASTGVYSATGSTADVASDLDGLVFTSTSEQLIPGLSTATEFTVSDIDSDGQSIENNVSMNIGTAAVGTNPVDATTASAGATIYGNSEALTTLEITNAGTVTLNNGDTNLFVALTPGTNALSLGSGSYITGIGTSGTDTITLGIGDRYHYTWLRYPIGDCRRWL